jgi:hypothetical protein
LISIPSWISSISGVFHFNSMLFLQVALDGIPGEYASRDLARQPESAAPYF